MEMHNRVVNRAERSSPRLAMELSKANPEQDRTSHQHRLTSESKSDGFQAILCYSTQLLFNTMLCINIAAMSICGSISVSIHKRNKVYGNSSKLNVSTCLHMLQPVLTSAIMYYAHLNYK